MQEGQALAHVLQRELREHGHAVVGLLAVDGDVVAQALEGLGRELLVEALDLLEHGHVGRGRFEPGQDSFQASIDGIDVPGGDAH
jgi:hypothetical protein